MNRHHPHARLLLLFLCIVSILCFGCKRQQDNSHPHLEVIRGGEQCEFPGKPYQSPLIIRAVNAENAPIPHLKLLIRNKGESDLTFSPSELETDAGGYAEAHVTAGFQTGDNYLEVFSPDNADPIGQIRFVNGIKITGNGQEGSAGNTLKSPVHISVVDQTGHPVQGVPIFITPDSDCHATPSSTSLSTDENGCAETDITLPDTTGTSTFHVEILTPPSFSAPVRALSVQAMSIDFYTLIINVLGGLALFILGMKMMSGGLGKLAGDRLKGLLHYCTANRIMGILVGTFIAAALQSSSAATVMTVGFVNAGLLNLAESIGIILGTHIGTSVTAQIITFDFSVVVMPAIIIGLIFEFAPRQKFHHIGELILGFGLLFFGMSLMGKDLGSIGHFPSFVAFFHSFDCTPVNGVMPFGALMGALLIGLFATTIVQSSSAVFGIVITLCAGGLVNFYTGVPLVLGANIGTTITALLASIPANRLAKQTALAHTLSNAIGVLLLVTTFYIPCGQQRIPVFFYVVDAITEGNAFAAIPQNLPRHIANAHTLFNLVTTIFFIPFINPLAKLCSRLIPIGEKRLKYQFLEPHLLDTPSLAIGQASFALGKMLRRSWKMTDFAVNQIFIPPNTSETNLDKIIRQEDRVDHYQREISEYLSEMMKRPMAAMLTGRISLLLHCTNDAERIGDRAINIADQAKRLAANGEKLSDEGAAELTALLLEVQKIYEYAMTSFSQPAPDAERFADRSEARIKQLSEEMENAHVRRMRENKCNAETGVIYAEVIGELCAIARHLCNIAERSSKVGAIPGLGPSFTM